MKKGINKEYDEIKNQLMNLRIKIQMIRNDNNKKEELEMLTNEVNMCRNKIFEIEREENKKKIGR